jgi:cell division protein FtsW
MGAGGGESRTVAPAQRTTRAASAPARAPAAPAVAPERMLTGAILALVCFGVVMVYSTSSATAVLSDGDPTGLVVRQAAYALLGGGAYLLFARMRPAALERLSGPLLLISGFLLIVLFLPGVGTTVNGSRRWISIGSVAQIQPSELAKLALALWIASALARDPGRITRRGGLIPYLVVTGLFAGLVLIEPDMGTASVMVALAFTMLLVGGAPARTLAGVLAAVGLLGVIAALAEPYRRERVTAFLDPWADPAGAGFQAVQAQVALGSGGVRGVGLGDGLQKAFYLPEAHTDMILATVGEELGLLGVLAVLAAFAMVALAGYRIAMGASSLRHQVLAAGLTTTIVAQAAINIGAVLGVLPVTGVPLPFVSFGGSSMVVLLASTGILVNIARRSSAARPHLVAAPSRAGDHRRGGDRRARDAGAGGGRRAARAGG